VEQGLRNSVLDESTDRPVQPGCDVCVGQNSRWSIVRGFAVAWDRWNERTRLCGAKLRLLRLEDAQARVAQAAKRTGCVSANTAADVATEEMLQQKWTWQALKLSSKCWQLTYVKADNTRDGCAKSDGLAKVRSAQSVGAAPATNRRPRTTTSRSANRRRLTRIPASWATTRIGAVTSQAQSQAPSGFRSRLTWYVRVWIARCHSRTYIRPDPVLSTDSHSPVIFHTAHQAYTPYNVRRSTRRF
jgi:hypothetical protein